jgi:hypothetical protein
MNCSPCGSSSNYSSVSTNQCVTLCGAGISTNQVNPMNINISSISISTLGNVSVAGNIYDTFSRLQTETPYTYMTSHVAFTPQYEIMGYNSTGTGSVFVDISNCLVQLSTTGSGSSRAFRQSLEYQVYQPGKGHQAIMTWTPQYKGTFDDSVAVRCGIYDDYRDKNTPAGTTGPRPYLFQSSIYGGLGQETDQPSMGHYFELSGNNWFVCERRNSPNNVISVVRIPQNEWNTDTLNPAFGNNPSGVTLQKDTESLFWMERQWLGVGNVNMGIYYDAKRIICHQFLNRNLQIPYTTLNKLPLRTEIEKVAGGSTNPVATASICWASQIDGQYIPMGALFSLPASVIKATTRVNSAPLPVLLLRLQQQYCRATFKMKVLELYGKAAGVFSILKNPTITGPITWIKNPDRRSMIEYAIFANGTTEPTNTITGGMCILSGFYDKRSSNILGVGGEELITETAFCSNIKGNPDVLCIAMAGFSDNDDVNANVRWIEIV